MKNLYILFCIGVISCQKQPNNDYNPNDTIITDSIKVTDTIRKAENPTGGMKLVPIVYERDTIKAAILKDEGLRLLLNKENLLDAKYKTEESLMYNNQDANTWYVLGNINQQMNKYDEALFAYKHAIELDPAHIDAIMKCAIVAGKTGDQFSACVYLHQACNLGDPEACEGVRKYCNN
ncbi:tetratricopeptide repeat protein [Flavobacterium sp. DGU11]|uniref:Tetratricopeptide repeat protein n=1 Tax=Flavobacterium arundinis TaxID=3139143 RepID=A0ABU9I131_9FLAO